MIYYGVGALLLFIAILPRGEARSTATWLAVIILVVFGGLRFEVGTDWDSYNEVFSLIKQGENFADLREENGFLSLIFVFQFFSDNYPIFIFTLFIISFSLKLYAITRFGAGIMVSLIIYFFTAFIIYDINGLRQGLAMGFVLCGGWFAIKSRIFAYLFAMILAISMHTVAVVALPMYFLANFSWLSRQSLNGRYIIALIVITIGYGLGSILATTDATVYFEFINLANRYDHYIEHFYNEFSLLGIGTLQRVFILGLALHMQGSLKCSQGTAAFLVNSYLIGTFVFFALSFNMEFMARTSYYYKIFDIILISIMYRSVRTSTGNILFIGMLAVLMFGSLYQLLSIPDGGLLPYRIQFLQ